MLIQTAVGLATLGVAGWCRWRRRRRRSFNEHEVLRLLGSAEGACPECSGRNLQDIANVGHARCKQWLEELQYAAGIAPQSNPLPMVVKSSQVPEFNLRFTPLELVCMNLCITPEMLELVVRRCPKAATCVRPYPEEWFGCIGTCSPDWVIKETRRGAICCKKRETPQALCAHLLCANMAVTADLLRILLPLCGSALFGQDGDYTVLHTLCANEGVDGEMLRVLLDMYDGCEFQASLLQGPLGTWRCPDGSLMQIDPTSLVHHDPLSRKFSAEFTGLFLGTCTRKGSYNADASEITFMMGETWTRVDREDAMDAWVCIHAPPMPHGMKVAPFLPVWEQPVLTASAKRGCKVSLGQVVHGVREGAWLRMNNGYVPLGDNSVRFFMQLQSDSPRPVNNRHPSSGDTPLHILCCNNFDYVFIKQVLLENPEAGSARVEHKLNVLRAYINWCMQHESSSVGYGMNKMSRYPLHALCFSGVVSLDILHMVHELFPWAVLWRDNVGNTPLPLLCLNSSSTKDMLSMLINCSEAKALTSSFVSSSTGILHFLALNTKATPEMVELVAERFPDSLHEESSIPFLGSAT